MQDPGDPSASPEGGLDCEEAVHRLYHFLDGELTEDRRSVIAQHLDACHDCLEAFEFEHVLRQTIANRCRDEVPADLRARVAAAIAHDPGTPEPPLTFRSP